MVKLSVYSYRYAFSFHPRAIEKLRIYKSVIRLIAILGRNVRGLESVLCAFYNLWLSLFQTLLSQIWTQQNASRWFLSLIESINDEGVRLWFIAVAD